MAHSGAQIIPTEDIVHAGLDQVVEQLDHVQLVRNTADPAFDIARGLDADKVSIHKFGTNPTVPNGTFADVWQHGPTLALYPWPTTTETFRVQAGGDPADTAAGAGARTVTIQFLDATGLEVEETLTLAGASASAATAVTGRRINRAFVTTVGTVRANNTGDIHIENSTTGQVVAMIGAGQGQTQQTMFTVPLDFTAFLFRVEINVAVGVNKDADVIMWQYLDAYTAAAPFGSKRLVREWLSVQEDSNSEFLSKPSFPPLTDVWFEAQGNGAATSINVDFDLICVRN